MEMDPLGWNNEYNDEQEIMFEKYLDNIKCSDAQNLERQALYMDFCRDLSYGIIQN